MNGMFYAPDILSILFILSKKESRSESAIQTYPWKDKKAKLVNKPGLVAGRNQ